MSVQKTSPLRQNRADFSVKRYVNGAQLQILLPSKVSDDILHICNDYSFYKDKVLLPYLLNDLLVIMFF